jgi:hypothetical protein
MSFSPRFADVMSKWMCWRYTWTKPVARSCCVDLLSDQFGMRFRAECWRSGRWAGQRGFNNRDQRLSAASYSPPHVQPSGHVNYALQGVATRFHSPAELNEAHMDEKPPYASFWRRSELGHCPFCAICRRALERHKRLRARLLAPTSRGCWLIISRLIDQLANVLPVALKVRQLRDGA